MAGQRGPLDRYTCADTFRLMDDYLDRELDSDETARVVEHLETCVGCAGMYRQEGDILRQIREKLRRVRVPTGVRQRIFRQIALER
jgi:anti-sigma factor (TIGR02949 family)